LYKKVTKQSKQITFTSKIIVCVTFGFLGLGSLLFFLTTSLPEKFVWYEDGLIAFFQTMTASTTAGFTTMNIATLSYSTLLLLLLLMTFGPSPSGTGGGLKSTTFAALLGHVKSTLSGKNYTSFWNHRISPKRMQI